MNNVAKLLSIFLTAITVSSCEIATTLRVENGNPPKIIMSGSGSLGRLVIRGPKTFRKSLGPDSWAYWCIKPKDKDSSCNVGSISPLSYGIIPDGYEQIYPEQGNAPPLSDERIYYIQVDTNDAPGASGCFVIRNGKFKYAKTEYELSEEDKR